MSEFVAALPMYDWPERRDQVDAEWASFRDALRARGVDAPERLVRRNADLPPVPGGIRDAAGGLLAPDPATLPRDEFDLATLWRHPKLLLAQTCWGPLETSGLAPHVRVIGQPDYSDVAGGAGPLYSSAIVMRVEDAGASVPPPPDGAAFLPIDLLRGRSFAFNEPHSMSGWLALERDLLASGSSMALFGETIQTGGHRASVRAVAEGRADLCTIDCRSWALAKAWEPAAGGLSVAGWTARRKGLPYICARSLPERITYVIQDFIAGTKDQSPR